MYKNSHEKSYGVPFSIKILRSYAILMLIVEIVTKIWYRHKTLGLLSDTLKIIFYN